MKNTLQLTELEKQMITLILHDYAKIGVENTEFHNTFGDDWEGDKKTLQVSNKELRGAFTSLKRKKIINHYNDPHCFNPIYPTAKLLEVCRENGIEITDKAMNAMTKYNYLLGGEI